LNLEDLRVGWYGKLPGLGDFISKRLPDEFVKPWDAWLQAGMIEGKATFEEDWEEHYLTFPIWRFLVEGGTLGEAAWMGLLMPSVDRVGRLFPFTIALPLGVDARAKLDIDQIDCLLNDLQRLVNKLLEDDQLEDFEQGLSEISYPRLEFAGLNGAKLRDLEYGTDSVKFDQSVRIDKLFGALALQTLFTNGASALWWVQATPSDNGIVRTSPAGLSAALFVDLVRGVT
jgi:type VI secretion system ImpM family protein